MATANTNYSNDGASTVTSVPGYDAGDNGMIDFWNAMARRRKAAAAPVAPKRTMGLGRATHAGPRSSGGGEGAALGGLKAQILRAQAAEAVARAQAIAGPMPTKMHPGGAGYASAFATPDVMGMSGAQRAAFLPGNAEAQLGGLTPGEIDRGRATGRAAGVEGAEPEPAPRRPPPPPPRFSGPPIYVDGVRIS